MSAISQYTTPAFFNDTLYLRDLIEILETLGSENAKCTVCNKNAAVLKHAPCCSTVCAREAFVIACQLEAALRAPLADVNNQYMVHRQGEVAEHAMNVMMAIVVHSSNAVVQKRTRHLLLLLARNNQKLPKSVFLEGNKVDTSGSRAVGGFAFIYKTTYSGTTVAAKRLIKSAKLDTRRVQEMHWQCCYEALIWKTLKHERLLSLSGIIKTDQDYFMISSWQCDGDSGTFLRDMIQNHERYRWGRFYQLLVYRWLLQVVEGLKYLHQQGVIHGDLHSKNVLVVNPRPNDRGHLEFDIALTDFGLSVIREANSCQQGSLRAGFIRAPEQMHPERYGSESREGRPTEESDIFAFAALCFQLYTTTGIYPAMQFYNYQMRRDIAISNLEPLDREVAVQVSGEYVSVMIPDELWEILERCWTVPEARPSLDWIEERLGGMQGSLSSV